MQSKATTVAAYLKSLPPERKKAMSAVRKAMRAHMPEGYVETMQYGMMGWVVPLKLYPPGYHVGSVPLPYAGLASQKRHMSLYLMGCYMEPKDAAWLKKEFKARGLKLDMGKSCIRFKKLEDLPLDVVGKAVAKLPVKEFVKRYERVMKR
ncbi:MAG: DUF1801 domain-containing protein [Rhodospirillaceae bacterium]